MKRLALYLGPLGFAAFQLTGFPAHQSLVMGTAFWMLLWWFTEAIPLGISALIPLVTFGGTGVLTNEELANAYANPLIYLFLGGFLLARGIERHNLHRRLALAILRRVGHRSETVLAGVMLATFTLSLWMSNTATAVMMLPLTLSLLTHLPGENQKLERSVLLGMAWGANLGGIGTLIGTPPNLVYAAFREETVGVQTGFMEWAVVAFPIALVLLVIAYFILRRGIPSLDLGTIEWPKPEPWTSGEVRVALIFSATALLWMTRQWIEPLVTPYGWSLPDQVIGMAGGILMFTVRDAQGAPLLRWKDARKVEWGILLLFGGGLSLAAGMQASGWLDALESLSGHPMPAWVWIFIFSAFGVWTTELFSNMALVSGTLPVALAVARAQGLEFEQLALPLTVGASCAFMLPMATPPNAIVFASGKVTVPYMAGRGFWLNIWATLVIGTVFSLL
ncbi:MAG: SLC13 family permease [Cryomorphaceae bacterium]|jgi:sodium-dependent dicarboxylate transporter 2/3/5|nr:SLC13 family permease [Cryomorphaceae bacterium]